MKNRHLTSKWAALVVAGALLLTLPGGFGQTVYAATAGKGEITVSGSGSVSVQPDVAYVTLGATTQNVNPKAAQEANNRMIAAVINTMKSLGIAENDIKTTNFYMYPNYDYQRSDNVITGYTVSNSVTVTVRDISKVGDILEAAVNAGANVSSGVQFSLLDSAEAYNEALKLAVENAKSKAVTLAGVLGKVIGTPSAVMESTGSYMPVYTEARAMADAGSSVPVQAGSLTVTANVQMTFEYDQ